jgi:hypothetical protein
VIADSTTAVYAVVDKSKKRKKDSTAEKEKAESYPLSFELAVSTPPSYDTAPVYDMAETTANAPPLSQESGAIDSNYSMISLENMYSSVNKPKQKREAEVTIQRPSRSTATKADKKKRQGTECKAFACIFITITIVAVITLICLVALFAEVSRLRMQNTSAQQSAPDQLVMINHVMQQLQQINNNLSELINREISRIEMDMTKTADMLNMSINLLHQENFEEIQQLNSTQDELGISVDMLSLQLDSEIADLNISFFQLVNNQTMSLQALNSSIQMDLMRQSNSLDELQLLWPGQSRASSLSSCAALNDLPWSFLSGYYWVRTSNGSAVHVYCDMAISCGNITGGWMRVAELDMTNSSHQCPSGFSQLNDSSKRTCRINSSSIKGCHGHMIPLSHVYSKVCGQIIAYQVGTTDAFQRGSPSPNIDANYVDGISFTHGSPRQHIWTFAAGASEKSSKYSCPCITSGSSPPAFLERCFFCETGNGIVQPESGPFYPEPLWDGAGCSAGNACCTFNTPPWFYKQLPPTTDDIEMRVCTDESRDTEDIAIESIHIYVQ